VLVEVGMCIRSARHFIYAVNLQVKTLQSVPVALRRIESGETFGPDNVRVERVASENTQRAAVVAAGLMGRRARRAVLPGRPIEMEDVESEAHSAVLIHQRDPIHLVAKVSPLQVRARGEALQDGRLGQAISGWVRCATGGQAEGTEVPGDCHEAAGR
jgi:flagella basal body P-ring formation protein FlgA